MSMAVLEELSRRRGVDAAEPEILANHRACDDSFRLTRPRSLNLLASTDTSISELFRGSATALIIPDILADAEAFLLAIKACQSSVSS